VRKRKKILVLIQARERGQRADYSSKKKKKNGS